MTSIQIQECEYHHGFNSQTHFIVANNIMLIIMLRISQMQCVNDVLIQTFMSPKIHLPACLPAHFLTWVKETLRVVRNSASATF